MQALFHRYWSLIRNEREWLKLAGGILLLGMVTALVTKLFSVDLLASLTKMAEADLQELGDQVIASSFVTRIALIFQRNMVVMSLMVLAGFVFGYIPFLSIYLNGLIIGSIGYQAIVEQHQLGLFLLSTMPHGIFEIPAMILAAAFGLRLGWLYLAPEARGRRKQTLNDTALDAVLMLLPVGLLLLIAATIEGGILFSLLA